MKKLSLALIFLFLGSLAVSAQKTFYSKEYKVGFKYPTTAKITTKPDNLVVISDALKGIAMVSFPHAVAGVYNADATITAGTITKDACTALSANDEPKKKKFGTTTFDKTEEVEGGMESIQPQEFYRTYHDGTCYEIRLSVGQNKHPRRAINDAPLFAQMYTLMTSMYFGK